MTRDVVVVGAGVSGLAAAHDLVRQGRDVVVLERQATVGGNAISERMDGFLMEHGPSSMNAAVPEALDFTRELGLESASVSLGANVRRRYLLDQGRLSGFAVHPLGFFVSGYLSLPARLSMLCEILRPRGTSRDDETIHDFASRRFGDEFSRKVMDPLAAGLFMGDAGALSVGAVFPRLVELERRFGSVTRGVLKARRASQPGRRLFSWPEGIGTLPRQLAQRLGSRIATGTVVRRIRPLASGFEVETAGAGSVRARALILAVQPHVASALLAEVEPATAAALGEIAAPPIGVVFLGYRRAQVSHPLDGLGFLSTRDGGRIISGAQFCSTMFGGRAPEGHVAIACYVGGARNPDIARLPAREMIGSVHAELSGVLGIGGPPVHARVRHWALGLPQYEIDHLERRRVIESAGERMPGLILTGNYLRGVSVANCLASARSAARAAHELLAGCENSAPGVAQKCHSPETGSQVSDIAFSSSFANSQREGARSG